jgi:large subunit ribosomal protein L24
MKLKKGDNVLVISGKDRGRTGKILDVFPKERNIVVEGMNIHKKHTKARRQGQKGQKIEVPARFDSSNVKIICPKCTKAVRIGCKITPDKKYRICKKCGEEL